MCSEQQINRPACSCVAPDFVALTVARREDSGALIRPGTEQSGCVSEIRGKHERSGPTGPQRETLLEQHQGAFVKSHNQNKAAGNVFTHAEASQIHTSVLRHKKTRKHFQVRPLMRRFLSSQSPSYQHFSCARTE